jgi:hypothetical protein
METRSSYAVIRAPGPCEGEQSAAEEGRRICGSADAVWLRGTPMVRQGQYIGQPGEEQYLPWQRFRA